MKRATTKPHVLNFSIIPTRVPPLPKLLPADSYSSENKDKHIIFDLTTTQGGCDDSKPSSTCQTESSEIKLVSSSSLGNLRPQIVLVYLHGANQNPINEIIFRLVNSYYDIIKQEKQLPKFKLDIVHSATHRDAQAVVQHYISRNHIVFIGGHSAGSGVAARLTIQPELTHSNEIKSYLSAQQHQVSSVSPENASAVSKNDDENKNQSSASSSASTTKAIQQQQLKNNVIHNSNQQQHRLPCILLGTSAPSFPQGVYGLCVLGELDGDGKSYTKNKDRMKSKTSTDDNNEKWKNMMNIVKAGNSGTAALVVPFNADHSLRIPTKSNPTDKDASTMSEETKMVSLELARKIHEFVIAYCTQQPLPFF